MSGVLVAFWAATRRPVDARVVTALEQLDTRLSGITEQIAAAAARDQTESDGGLGDAIGSSIDLGEVLQRTLAATAALAAVDGSRIRVQRTEGTPVVAVQGIVDESSPSLEGPPDGGPFSSGLASWDVESRDGLRSGLVVPLGLDQPGSLAVYSRLPNAFDAEAVKLLATVAKRAAPAVQNALRYLEVQELAATDSRTGLGSASAFEETFQREFKAAQRHHRPLCLIQIDLDNFGDVNKEHSHAIGNDLLVEFGARVLATIRGSDSAFRNSGGADEFFLILPETTREYAELLYGRLDFEMAARPFPEGITVTMSSGLAELRPEDTLESLAARAARAQKLAKDGGKNRLVTDADRRVSSPE